MKEHKTVVGKKLIEILMFSMYPDEKIIYREYIQNARDSIKDAVEAGVLNQLKDGHIVVNIDSYNHKITITDNGIGVPVEKVEPVLLNIADSTKDGIDSAGQFGIGRLVGGGYCKKLSFKTSYKGEKYASEISFDVEAARAILDDDTDRRSAAEVIDAIRGIELYEEEADKHYFIVTLDQVRPEYPELLNQETISDYLRDVAPVDYQFIFKNNLVQTKIPTDYIELQKQAGYFKVTVNEETDIRKRYGLKIDGTQDTIDDLAYFKISDDDYGLLAWGWYAVTAFSKAIPATDRNRGIRLRKHNILIGASNLLNQFFKEPRGNNYFYGEIHAVHPKLKPESSRSGLAPTPEAIRFQQHLKDFFLNLHSLYHLASDMKTATRDVVAIEVEKAQATEQEDTPEVTRKWEVANKKLEKATNKVQTEAEQKVAEIYKKKLEESIKNSSVNLVSDIVEPYTQSVKVREHSRALPEDIFFDLKDSYSSSEIELIKRIFKSFTDNCPIAQKKLIEELKKKVIKDLGK